jgi:hypothetical protein
LKSNDLEAFRIAPATARLETLRSVQEFQENHSFQLKKVESMLIAPATTRIETLRSFKEFIAFPLKSNDLEAF